MCRCNETHTDNGMRLGTDMVIHMIICGLRVEIRVGIGSQSRGVV